MDQLDWQILAALQEDGRRSYRQIASDLGASSGTVRLRVKQLIDDGLVRDRRAERTRARVSVPGDHRPGSCARATQAWSPRSSPPGRRSAGSGRPRPAGSTCSSRSCCRTAAAFGPYREEFLAGLPGCRDIEVFEIWDVRKFSYKVADVAESGSGTSNGATSPTPRALPETRTT